jgi:hypothetical protein
MTGKKYVTPEMRLHETGRAVFADHLAAPYGGSFTLCRWALAFLEIPHGRSRPFKILFAGLAAVIAVQKDFPEKGGTRARSIRRVIRFLRSDKGRLRTLDV